MFYRVKIRRGLAEVRPNAEQLEGRVFFFREGWVITEEDSSIYASETAMLPITKEGYPKYPEDGPIWIASGDLVQVEAPT